MVPEAPAQPTTVLNTIANTVTVDWGISVNNGDPITSYNIQIRGTDGVSFFDELTGCDGTNSYNIEKTACLLTVSSIKIAPFSLL